MTWSNDSRGLRAVRPEAPDAHPTFAVARGFLGLDFAGRYALPGVPRSAMTHGGADRAETQGGETADFSLQTSVTCDERLAERCQHHAAAARSTAHRARDGNVECLFEAVEELACAPVAHADVARSLGE